MRWFSHAHIDHSGRLPFSSRGYANRSGNPRHARSQRDHARRLGAHQEKDAEFLARREKKFAEPLYGLRHAARTIELMTVCPTTQLRADSGSPRQIHRIAGHILGSASVALDCTEDGVTRRLVFSGDVGRAGLPIIRDPVPPSGPHVVIMESTYGNRDHEPVEGARARLAETIKVTAARGGRILIPAFAVGRTQEIIYERTSCPGGCHPAIPVYIDSPWRSTRHRSSRCTLTCSTRPRTGSASQRASSSYGDLYPYAQESGAERCRGPISSSRRQVMEARRILHHLATAVRSRNTILVVGFQASIRSVSGVERQPILKIFGEEVPLRAQSSDQWLQCTRRPQEDRWLDASAQRLPT